MERGEDEPTETIRDEQRLLPGRIAHLGLGRRAHPSEPATGLGHESLDHHWREPRHRDDVPALARGEAGVHREEVPVVDDPAAVVRDEDLLAAGIDDDPAGRAQRARDRAELPLLLLEVLHGARADVLRHDPADRHAVDAERVEELRQEAGRGPVREVHDDLRASGYQLLRVRDVLHEGLAVGLTDARGFEDAPDIVVGHPAEVLTEEDALHLALRGLAHVERVLVEELDVTHAHIERRHPHVHASGRADVLGMEAIDGQRSLRQVSDVHARAHDAAHE